MNLRNLKNWLVPIMLGGGMGLVYLLPNTGDIRNSAIIMTLPNYLEDWNFEPKPPSEKEISILGNGTEFSTARCTNLQTDMYYKNGQIAPYDLQLSVVLSGHDMNASIHRPERCLPSQGHKIISSDQVPITLKNGRTIVVKRLFTNRTIADEKDSSITYTFSNYTYYFFVGENSITNDHYTRTYIDMKDRLFRGVDQRWAYVSVSAIYGNLPWLDKPLSSEEIDNVLKQFISIFATRNIDWSKIK